MITSEDVEELEYLYQVVRSGLRKHKALTIVSICLAMITVWIMTHFNLWQEARLWWKDNLESINVAIGIAALILAFIACIGLEWMRHRVSTRFIGEFPDHLYKITKLVKSASVRIDSLADCVDYGSFFNPEAHETLVREIVDARQKRSVSVRMVICGPVAPKPISAASKWSDRSFRDQDQVRDRLEAPRFRDGLRRYLAVINAETAGFKEAFLDDYLKQDGGNSITKKRIHECIFDGQEFAATDADEAALEELLLIRHRWFLKRVTTFGTATEVRKNDDSSSVFLWIVDGLEAVFLFVYPGADALAFTTRDPALIRVFNIMFDDKFHNGSKLR